MPLQVLRQGKFPKARKQVVGPAQDEAARPVALAWLLLQFQSIACEDFLKCRMP
jgi:hypothetical protein